MGRHGFPGIPRWFGMQLPLVAMVLREASALMRISSKHGSVGNCLAQGADGMDAMVSFPSSCIVHI